MKNQFQKTQTKTKAIKSNYQSASFMSWSKLKLGLSQSKVPQGSILRTLVFPLSVNKISDQLSSSAQLFIDDTLFSIIHMKDF